MSRKAKPTPKRAAPAPLVERTASEITRDRLRDYALGPGPDRITLYRGICEGGPHHGKPLYHAEPVMRIARNKISFRMLTWAGDETDEIRIDHYHHEDGRWMWKERTT